MRIILAILASISFLSPKAQTHLPVSSLNYNQWQPFPDYSLLADSSHSNNKWHLSKYASFSAGAIFFNGGASFLAAPVGLQLSRSLNKNVYAFAGVSAAPVLFSINRMLMDPGLNPSYPGSNFSNAYRFGLNSRVEMGLMYINDAKTFSISGSVGVDRSYYPVYPTNRANTKKQ
jgi:hypothetical protein